MAKGYTYLIRCPRTYEVVYIGACDSYIHRFSAHYSAYTPVGMWMKSIRPLKAIMEVVFAGGYYEAYGEEGHQIEKYTRMHCVLFNLPLGGGPIYNRNKPHKSRLDALKENYVIEPPKKAS